MRNALHAMVMLCAAVAGAALCRAEEAPSDFFRTHLLARKALETRPEDATGEDVESETAGAVRAAELYEQFASGNPTSPEAALCRVLRGIVLWRDLKNMVAAEKDFALAAGAAGDSATAAEAVHLGRRWLARVRMTRVARACHSYYIEEVEYPENLRQLVEAKLLDGADIADPWGDAFIYAATEHRLFRGIPRQQYVLRSANVPDDLGKTQELLNKEGEFAKTVSLRSTSVGEPRRVMVTVNDEPIVIEQGKTKGGLAAVRIEIGRAVLCSSDYVVVLTR